MPSVERGPESQPRGEPPHRRDLRVRPVDFAVLKTVGFTPRQVAATLVSPFAGLALVAGVVSVPLGLALYVGAYRVAGGDGTATVASWPALTLVRS
jgi:hypothetical protein